MGLHADKGQLENGARQMLGQQRIETFLGFLIPGNLLDELPGNRLLRLGKDVNYRAFLHDAAVFHHRHAVADFAHHVHFVGDQHNGQVQLTVDIQQQFENRICGLGIKRRGGFIAQQHARVIGQCAGNADALLLPAAELRRIGILAALQANQRDQLRHSLLDLRFGHTGDLHGEGDILADGA
ncbi:hypothetical protein D3C79_528770 [compost metagenome]